jgi:hypothetical protein
MSHPGFERKWVWVEGMHRGGVFRRADDINTNPVLTEYCRVAGVGAIFAVVGGVILRFRWSAGSVVAGDGGGWRGWSVFVLLLFWGILATRRFVPAARRFFRQRANRVVAEVGRWGIALPPPQLNRRRMLIHRLTHDPELLGAVKDYASEKGVSMAVAMARVERYAREIVPSFNAFLYFRVGMPLAAWISSSLYDVRVDQERGFTALEVVEDASVVFVMNHRSNLDYVLLAHLVAHRTAISFAAGEWAAMCGLWDHCSAAWARSSCGAVRATSSTGVCWSASFRWPPRGASRRPSSPRAG